MPVGNKGFVGGSYNVGMSESIDKLEDIAREELAKPRADAVERRKVFISFKHTDKNLVDLLRGRAKNDRNDLDFIDMSLQVPFNSENAEYIKSGIRERIKQSSVTVVVVTDTTHESDWVNWEINESKRLGKGVVVLDRRTTPSSKLPSAIEEHSDSVKMVTGGDNDLYTAIEEAAQER